MKRQHDEPLMRTGVIRCILVSLLAILTPSAARSAEKLDAARVAGRDDAWFQSDEGKRVLDNILSWQNANGGWWKANNYSAARPPAPDAAGWHRTSTFDNKATHTELRILARAYRIHHDEKYRQAFSRGMKFIYDAQYPSGGWPQRFPLEKNYGRYITFNDGAFVGVMGLLFDLAAGNDDFAWAKTDEKDKARESFDRGLKCILDAQIKVNGTLTGWPQQCDENTLEPTKARAYELPAIAGGETAEVVVLLMRIEKPDARVKEAVRSAVQWFEASKITGKRLKDVSDPNLPKGRDRVLVDDPSGETLWARFYDIETNRPFFCGRDGIKRWSLAEIEIERRLGYAWIRPFGAQVLKQYPKWAARNSQ